MKNKKQKRCMPFRPGTVGRLEYMLEAALNDSFEEGDYDESRLSRLEVKWKHFISASLNARHRVEEEKEQIKTLISDISHQTKTPIANILLYSQLLQEKVEDPALLPLVENIKSQSEKLDFLIRSLIKASRLETEILVLSPERQAVAPMLEGALKGVKEAAAAKGIEILVEETKAVACFDRKWTEEAVFNLLDNGVKYSKEGSTIKVSVSDYEMFAAVHVEDQGPGISEEEQAQIFERFYRSRRVSQEKGVGIGLFLVREIAGRQNGYVKVASVPGKGSRFSFFMSKRE